jgi:hypothetical protein
VRGDISAWTNGEDLHCRQSAFGVFAVVGGILVVGITVVALVESGEFARAIGVLWPYAVAGFVLIVVGVIYVRAPLFRERQE